MIIWKDDPAFLPGSYYQNGKLSDDGLSKAFGTLVQRIEELEAKLAAEKAKGPRK